MMQSYESLVRDHAGKVLNFQGIDAASDTVILSVSPTQAAFVDLQTITGYPMFEADDVLIGAEIKVPDSAEDPMTWVEFDATLVDVTPTLTFAALFEMHGGVKADVTYLSKKTNLVNVQVGDDELLVQLDTFPKVPTVGTKQTITEDGMVKAKRGTSGNGCAERMPKNV